MKEIRKPKKIKPVEVPKGYIFPTYKPANTDLFYEAHKIDMLDRSTFYTALRNACLIHYSTYSFPTPENNQYGNDVGVKGTLVGYMLYYVSKFNLGEIDKKNLAHLIGIVKKSRLFDCPEYKRDEVTAYLVGLIQLIKWKWAWIRNPEHWSPPNNGSKDIFSSLARFLLAKYYIPEFFDKVWFSNNETQQQWFVNVGLGENLRTQKGLPIPLTKKMAHHTMSAPSMCSINQAIRWGQIMAMGGNERIAIEVIRTPLGDSFDNDEFWTSVIRFFIDNPFLDCYHYRQIYDYLFNQKFQNRGNRYINGVLQILGPEQPNLSMHRRDPLTLLEQVAAWHGRLHRGYGLSGETCKSSWNTCGIKPFEIKERKVLYEIRELLTSDELFEEGREMHHCAGSYVHSCSNGTCAIFSLAKYSEEETDRMATIQVELATRTITQTAKKCNEKTTSEDWGIIKQWASINRLTESKWIRY